VMPVDPFFAHCANRCFLAFILPDFTHYLVKISHFPIIPHNFLSLYNKAFQTFFANHQNNYCNASRCGLFCPCQPTTAT
jgi:hypothetical protein